MTIRIPLAVPQIGSDAIDMLAECINTNYVSSVGAFVGEFETAFASSVGAAGAVACASGTAAIHLALLSAGVGPGDEVFVSDLTFIASANPARYIGATVTLVDSEHETWNIDSDLVITELERRARAGERQPAAIVVVHLLGHPANIAPLLRVAAEFGIAVIEDAAEALGASWCEGDLAGRQAGTVAGAGCYSFNGNKIITTGGGGMVTSDDDAFLRRVRHLSTQAKTPGIAYDHDEVGFNYRLTNLAAALGVSQLRCLDSFLAAKRAIAERYDQELGDVAGVEPPPSSTWARRSAWLYSVTFDSVQVRERVRLALLSEGIDSRPIWKPLHQQRPYLGMRVLRGGVAEDIAARALSIPCSVSLSEAEQTEVVDVITRTLADG